MNEINQEDLEHGQDHPITTEIPEFEPEWVKKLYEKLNKSAEITNKWIQDQNSLWDIANENNK
jgi:hypothetical protein